MDNITARMIAQSQGRTENAKDAIIAYQLTSPQRAAETIQKGEIFQGIIIAIALIISAYLQRKCVPSSRSCGSAAGSELAAQKEI